MRWLIGEHDREVGVRSVARPAARTCRCDLILVDDLGMLASGPAGVALAGGAFGEGVFL
jgi:hypothetical protein